VFLGYSSRHKGVKCLEVKTGRVYISRDVVFDETVFPFQSLHPNAGALLRKEILLLPESLQPTSVFDHGGVNNVDQRTNPANTIVSAGVQNFAEEANGENLVQNGENLGQNNGEAGAGSEVDPPVTPGRQSDGSPCRSAPGLMQSGGSGRSASGGILRTFNQQERDTSQSSSAARTINQQERDTSPTSSAADQRSAGQGDSAATTDPGSAGSSAQSSADTGSSANQNAAPMRMTTRLQKGIKKSEKIISWYD
jgi:hypothetical protein